MPLIFLVVGLLLGGPVLGIIDIEADDLSLED